MKKVYFSPENRVQNPFAGYPDVNEHIWCRRLAEVAKVHLERCGLFVTIADPAKSIKVSPTRQEEANAGKYDLYVTVHNNGFDGTARGVTCLYYKQGNVTSIDANQIMYDHLMAVYPGTTKRGIKDGTSYIENNTTNMVSIYPEIGFADNPDDARWLMEDFDLIAEAFAKAICCYLGVLWIPEKQNPASGVNMEAEHWRKMYEAEETNFAVLMKKYDGRVEDIRKLEQKVADLEFSLATKTEREGFLENEINRLKAEIVELKAKAPEVRFVEVNAYDPDIDAHKTPLR